MGLYDRDYMRDKPSRDDDDGPGMERLDARRRRWVRAGVIVIVTGLLALWVLN